jgi:integrase
MPYANNKMVLADGRITLYLRDDVKNPVWQCRITMKSVRGYIKRSTGETDPTRATMVAIKLLGELEHRSANDQPLSAKRFRDVAAAYLRDAHTRWKEGRNSQGRYNIIRGTLNRYHVPYFGKRDITKIKKKDLMDYRAWRQDYWITGPGKDLTIYHKVRPSSATLKQEWTILRGVFSYGIEMGDVSPLMMPMLAHEEYKVGKRPAFNIQEYRLLHKFMRRWVREGKDARHRAERELIRNYTLIMVNSGLRKGEARYLKWADLNLYETEHGSWPTLQVNGKTGERLVVCQPNARRFFARLKERKHHTGQDDYIFCHEDGQPILHMKTFPKMLGEAGLLCDSQGRKRSIYSLRHTYATFRLENGTNVYWLRQNMGTSVQMIERHYGQTKVLTGIEFETARRKKQTRRPDLAPPTVAMMSAPEPAITSDDEDN